VSDETSITNGDEETPGLFQTFIGAGFGTVQIERAVGTDPPPPAVSGRRYLRDNLPGIYSEGDFGMRLISGFEALLDPLVAALDNLPEHFDPVYAPRMAPELMRRRGTKAGLELALALAFPGVPFRIEDGGAVSWSLDLEEAEPAAAPAFVVYCDVPLTPARSGAVARLIDQAKPAHVTYRLRVKAAPRQSGSAT
jgi:hypothetical protein